MRSMLQTSARSTSLHWPRAKRSSFTAASVCGSGNCRAVTCGPKRSRKSMRILKSGFTLWVKRRCPGVLSKFPKKVRTLPLPKKCGTILKRMTAASFNHWRSTGGASPIVGRWEMGERAGGFGGWECEGKGRRRRHGWRVSGSQRPAVRGGRMGEQVGVIKSGAGNLSSRRDSGN